MASWSNLAFRLLAIEPILAIQRRRVSQGGITVFMYHDIGDDHRDIDVWQVVRKSDFLHQVDYIRRHYDLVSLDHALQARHEAHRERPLAVLTFDDGHHGNIEHLLPIVEREQLPVTLYIATGHVETGEPYWFDRLSNHLQSDQVIDLDLSAFGLGAHRFNATHGAQNWARIHALLMLIKEQAGDRFDEITDAIVHQVPMTQPAALRPLRPHEVTELARCKDVTIGAHTRGHEILTNVGLDLARHSIEASRIRLEAWTGKRPLHFAYPAGYYNPRLAQLVEDMHFASAMTADHGIWQGHDSVFRIPRIAVGRYDHPHKFKVNAVRA